MPFEQLVPKLAERIAHLSPDQLEAALARLDVLQSGGAAGPMTVDDIAKAILRLHTKEPPLREVERAVLTHALLETGGNVSAAARLLGMERKALERRIERLRIDLR